MTTTEVITESKKNGEFFLSDNWSDYKVKKV